MQYWLVKTEPDTYSFQDLLRDKETMWDGVRNYAARNNLRLMKEGDMVLVYHSVSEKSVVGVAKVSQEHFVDPTSDDDRWSAVKIIPVSMLEKPVSLATLKSDPIFADAALIKQSRLSVMPLTKTQYNHVVNNFAT